MVEVELAVVVVAAFSVVSDLTGCGIVWEKTGDDTEEEDEEDGDSMLLGVLEKMGVVLDGVGVHRVSGWVEGSGALLGGVKVTGVLGETKLDEMGELGELEELELTGMLLATLELWDVTGAQAVPVTVTVSTSEKEKSTSRLPSHEEPLKPLGQI